MHWSEEIAARLIERKPDKEEYVCAAGISPSGSVHIGNFRDVATSWFVVKALRKMGKKAKFIFSWDEYDRLRKIPVNVAKADGDMEKYIGMPYVDVKNPFGNGHTNYAKHFEAEFVESIINFSIDGLPLSGGHVPFGKYTDYSTALKKREIFDIIDSFTQEAAEGKRALSVNIYCPACGWDDKNPRLSDDCTEADYVCACSHSGKFNF